MKLKIKNLRSCLLRQFASLVSCCPLHEAKKRMPLPSGLGHLFSNEVYFDANNLDSSGV